MITEELKMSRELGDKLKELVEKLTDFGDQKEREDKERGFTYWLSIGRLNDAFFTFTGSETDRHMEHGMFLEILDKVNQRQVFEQGSPELKEIMLSNYKNDWIFASQDKDGNTEIFSSIENRLKLRGIVHTYIWRD